MKKFLELSSWSRKAAIGSMLIMAMLFAACGDDDSSFAPRDNTVSDSDIVVESFDDLPVCSSKREGATAYIKDEKTAYICTDSSWVPEEETFSSSSETTQSSSSITTATPCNVDGVNNCVYGSLTDSRDGQTYKTVTIGDQVWMAENLNYAYTDVPYEYNGYTSDSTSWCYNDDPSNCAKYGRLYTWAAAVDSVGTWTTNGKGCGDGSKCSPTGTIRGICPEGWHLPDTTEWETLFTAVGGVQDESYTIRWNGAGTALKSTSGWNEFEGESGNGTDAFGFSALPAGARDGNGDYYSGGDYAFFWSSTEGSSSYAYSMYLHYGNGYAYLNDLNKNYGHSVRCLKD